MKTYILPTLHLYDLKHGNPNFFLSTEIVRSNSQDWKTKCVWLMEEFVSPNLSWSNFEKTLVVHWNTIVCMLFGFGSKLFKSKMLKVKMPIDVRILGTQKDRQGET
jgi:hypothetical protein